MTRNPHVARGNRQDFETWYWENDYEPSDEPDFSDITRDDTNACPECDEGVVMNNGPMEWETGHQPYICHLSCGFCG